MIVSPQQIDKLRSILKATEPQLSEQEREQVIADCIDLVPILAKITQTQKRGGHD